MEVDGLWDIAGDACAADGGAGDGDAGLYEPGTVDGHAGDAGERHLLGGDAVL